MSAASSNGPNRARHFSPPPFGSASLRRPGDSVLAVAGRSANFRVGRVVRIACDGCERGYTATISHIASNAEYTPPVIYSNDARSKLVFLVEARPDTVAARGLHPGLPIEVTR